jgi:ribosomal protein S18 acetylase RimI-like enzyme
LRTVPAAEVAAAPQAAAIERAFRGYLAGSLRLPSERFGPFVQQQGIDLAASRLAVDGERVAGFCYAGTCGGRCRVAGLGVIPAYRRQGLATSLLRDLIARARDAGYRALTLESYEQNDQAMPLYWREGFRPVRRLYGYTIHDPPGGEEASGAAMVSLAEAGRQIDREGDGEDLPYPLCGEGVRRLGGAYEAWRLGSAVAVLAPYAARVWVHAVYDRAGYEAGRALVRALWARYPGRAWTLSESLPAELGKGIMEPLGFQRHELNQVQMERAL